MSVSPPRISVVIPAHNSRETIQACLDSVVGLDHPSYEIIIVDDGSTDDTAELCARYGAAIRLIRLEQGGPSLARNRGLEVARGELVAFTDADCVVDRAWLTELEAGLDRPDTVGAGGDQRSPHDELPFGRAVQDFMKTIGFMTGYIKPAGPSHIVETDHNPSCNALYRKDALIAVGGFDESLWPGEDVDVDYRLIRKGRRLTYNPRAVVSHYRPKTYWGFARMMLRYGACRRRLMRKYGLTHRLQVVPFALVAIAVAVAVLLVIFPNLWPLLPAPIPAVWLYFLVRTGSPGRALRFLALFAVTLAAWNWGFLAGSGYEPFGAAAEAERPSRGA